MRTVNIDVFINELLRRGVIERVRRGRYMIPEMSSSLEYDRGSLHRLFGIEVEPGRFRFCEDVIRAFTPVGGPRKRTIERFDYHSQSRNIEAALARIPFDKDGVKRSYGIEFEINALTEEQEDALARLLDKLPPHVTERDGSLSDTGVEIIFEPMSRELAIATVKKLQAFVMENDVDMNNTGMHITFGVSNSQATEEQLTVRLNRLALAVKAVGTRESLIELFGRDFNDYARLPGDLLSMMRHRAFRVRNSSCWECRLVDWSCNISKVMEFFRVTEVLFHRPFKAEDFMKVFRLLGSNVDDF